MMISDGKIKLNRSSSCAAQHGIISTSLVFVFFLLIVSPAIPSAGAQTPGGLGNEQPLPYNKFTPSMAIIIAILIAALFFMGFFTIYIRQCHDPPSVAGGIRQLGASMRGRRAATRGLEPEVIQTFPTFVYSVVKGLKIGKGALECAVCLCEFEDDETLRLIPKCDHVFHPECIDEWLSSHVTCPVCRADLVPQPGDAVPEQKTEPEPETATENSDIGAVSVRIDEEHVVNVLDDEPALVDRNKSVNRNRPPKSGSVRLPSTTVFGLFPRSHTTGHSLVQPGENTERFTLRLPEEVRKQMVNRALNRSTTFAVTTLPREGSSRRGYRTGRGEGSSRGRNYRQLEPLDPAVKSDRWVFSMAPPFFSRASSIKSPKVEATIDGEGSSSSMATTPKGSKSAVRLPSFKCLEPRSDESHEIGLLPNGSDR